jgi:hypothetical protein
VGSEHSANARALAEQRRAAAAERKTRAQAKRAARGGGPKEGQGWSLRGIREGRRARQGPDPRELDDQIVQHEEVLQGLLSARAERRRQMRADEAAQQAAASVPRRKFRQRRRVAESARAIELDEDYQELKGAVSASREAAQQRLQELGGPGRPRRVSRARASRKRVGNGSGLFGAVRRNARRQNGEPGEDIRSGTTLDEGSGSALEEWQRRNPGLAPGAMDATRRRGGRFGSGQ